MSQQEQDASQPLFTGVEKLINRDAYSCSRSRATEICRNEEIVMAKVIEFYVPI
jgi:hypothetical protein